MTIVDPFAALCCLIGAVDTSNTNAAGVPFDHKYPSAALTWPYCTHHAIVARIASKTTEPPPTETSGTADMRAAGRVWYHRFELDVVRCGPPAPTTGECLDDLYGDCDSDANHDTLAGHQRAIVAEAERLHAELLDLWCQCLRTLPPPGGTTPIYSAGNPRWIESVTTSNEGRFTAIRFRVGALLG